MSLPLSSHPPLPLFPFGILQESASEMIPGADLLTTLCSVKLAISSTPSPRFGFGGNTENTDDHEVISEACICHTQYEVW